MWLNSLRCNLSGAPRKIIPSRGTARRRRSTLLGVEALEDRLVPTSASFTVNSLADLANPGAGVTTLRSALTAAINDHNTNTNIPDVITFSVDGTIALTSALPVISNEAVSIQGPGASALTVQGDGQNDALLTLAAGATADVSGLTLDGDQGKNAGVSVAADASLLVQNAFIQNTFNINGAGGGISNQGGSVVVSDTRLSNDEAQGNGGGVASIGGSVTVSQSTFTDDAATSYGGAIYVVASSAGAGGDLTVLDSAFTGNIAGHDGGAIELSFGAYATIADSTFTGNSAVFGGTISLFSVGSSSAMTDSLLLSSSTLAGNTATSTAAGGGLFIAASSDAFTSSVVMRDTIVAGNHARGNALSDIVGALDPTSAYNLIGDGTGLTGISDGSNGNQVGADAQPIDPKLGPLANNGGATQTFALLPGSPAIDRGGPDPVGDALTTTDQRGDPRIVSQSYVVPPTGGDGRDIGAYELAAQTTPTILTVDSLADANPPSGALTLREALQAAAGTISLASLPAGQVSAGSAYFFEIQFAVSGTIALASPLPTVTTNTPVVIQGPGESLLTIQGDGLNDTMLTVAPGAAATLSGLTLDGDQSRNAGISVGADASLLVESAVIQNMFNLDGAGGGISNQGGSLMVTDTILNDDQALGNGGSIAGVSGSITVRQSTFSGEVAANGFGGAIYDIASPGGGGGVLTVLDSTFTGNSAGHDGGAIELSFGAYATIADSTFTGNNAAFGGAISMFSVGSSTATTASLLLSSSTLSGNAATSTATAAGGGLLIEASTTGFTSSALLRDTIVAGNHEGNNGLGDLGDIVGPLDPASAYNLVGDGDAMTGISNNGGGNLVGTAAAPVNPMLGPLANNGGSTETLALLPGSPAIDAGNTELAGGNTDQRGFSRQVGPNVDIGAVEYQYDLAASAIAPSLVSAGGAITYNLTVTNNGPDLVTPVLTDAVPAGTTFVSFTAHETANVTDPAAGQTGTVTATLTAPLDSGASATYTLVVQTASGNSATITNTASFGPTTDDINAANNIAMSTTTAAVPITLSGLPVVNGSSAAINIVSATGNGTTATIATGTAHGFWVGELVTLTGTSPGGPGGLAGTVTVTGVPSATTFQFASTDSSSETFSGATVTAALAGAQRSMVDSIVYNFNEPVNLTAAAFTITVVVNNTTTGNMVGVAPMLNVAPVPFTNEWVVTFTDPVNNSVVGNSIANGAYSISINPALVTAVSGGQNLSAGETDTFYRLYGDVTGAQSVKNVDANAFNRAWGNASYSGAYNAALDYNGDGKFTNIDANAFNRAFNTRYIVVVTI